MKVVKAFVMSKSTPSPLFLENNETSGKDVETSSAKTSAPDFTSNASQGQCSSSYGSSRNLVYVRRKPEVDSSKRTGCGSQSIKTNCDPGIESNNHEKTFKFREDLKEPENKTTNMLSTSGNSSACISAEKPSLTASVLREAKTILSPSDFTPHITGADPLPADKQSLNFKQLHERYCQLQDVLRELDHANQDDYIQTLRSMSSVELSRHALDLERRSIQLTLEEAKELQRACGFNVLESYPDNK